jgi:hypothetical protein
MDFPIKCPVVNSQKKACRKKRPMPVAPVKNPVLTCTHPLLRRFDLNREWKSVPCQGKKYVKTIFEVDTAATGEEVFVAVLKRLKLCPSSHPLEIFQKSLRFLIVKMENDPRLNRLLSEGWLSLPKKLRNPLMEHFQLEKGVPISVALRRIYSQLELNQKPLDEERLQERLLKLYQLLSLANQPMSSEEIAPEVQEQLLGVDQYFRRIPRKHYALLASFFEVPLKDIEEANGEKFSLTVLTKIGYESSDTPPKILTKAVNYMLRQLRDNGEFQTLLDQEWDSLPINTRTSLLNVFKLPSTTTGVNFLKHAIAILGLDQKPLDLKEIESKIQKLWLLLPNVTEEASQEEMEEGSSVPSKDFYCSYGDDTINCHFTNRDGQGVPSVINVSGVKGCARHASCSIEKEGVNCSKEHPGNCQTQGYAYHEWGLEDRYRIGPFECRQYSGTLLKSNHIRDNQDGQVHLCNSEEAKDFKLSDFLRNWLKNRDERGQVG